MPLGMSGWRSVRLGLCVVGWLFGPGLVGCQRQAPAPRPEPAPSQESAPALAEAAGDARWRQSFREATRDASQDDEPPLGAERPPDVTCTGKPTAKLLQEVKRAWDAIPLINDEGQCLRYRVTLDTEQGDVELTLFPAWAPNHVRSFLALAKVGYYDGLVFDRVLHQVSEDKTIPDLTLVEAGCPTGTGKPGYGSIGYWLKPEFNPELKHEEGTVGACRGEEEDTAACRFYINLGKAPTLDGHYTVFGKVTRGLEVARIIFRQPVRADEEDEEGYHRPEKPVVIRTVVIHPPEADAPAHPGKGN